MTLILPSTVQHDLTLQGYQLYAVQNWLLQRSQFPLLAVYTGIPQHTIAVSPVLELPSLPYSRPKETPLGTIPATSLANFRSDYTIVLIPNGDYITQRDNLFTNIVLLRTGSSGRSALTLELPSDATKLRFASTYRLASYQHQFPDTALEIVKLLQAALTVFGVYSHPIDGLLCDFTVAAMQEWAKVFPDFVDPSADTRDLDPSLLSAILSLLLATRNKLATVLPPSQLTKDPFLHPHRFLNALHVYASTYAPTSPSPKHLNSQLVTSISSAYATVVSHSPQDNQTKPRKVQRVLRNALSPDLSSSNTSSYLSETRPSYHSHHRSINSITSIGSSNPIPPLMGSGITTSTPFLTNLGISTPTLSTSSKPSSSSFPFISSSSSGAGSSVAGLVDCITDLSDFVQLILGDEPLQPSSSPSNTLASSVGSVGRKSLSVAAAVVGGGGSGAGAASKEKDSGSSSLTDHHIDLGVAGSLKAVWAGRVDLVKRLRELGDAAGLLAPNTHNRHLSISSTTGQAATRERWALGVVSDGDEFGGINGGTGGASKRGWGRRRKDGKQGDGGAKSTEEEDDSEGHTVPGAASGKTTIWGGSVQRKLEAWTGRAKKRGHQSVDLGSSTLSQQQQKERSSFSSRNQSRNQVSSPTLTPLLFPGDYKSTRGAGDEDDPLSSGQVSPIEPRPHPLTLLPTDSTLTAASTTHSLRQTNQLDSPMGGASVRSTNTSLTKLSILPPMITTSSASPASSSLGPAFVFSKPAGTGVQGKKDYGLLGEGMSRRGPGLFPGRGVGGQEQGQGQGQGRVSSWADPLSAKKRRKNLDSGEVLSEEDDCAGDGGRDGDDVAGSSVGSGSGRGSLRDLREAVGGESGGLPLRRSGSGSGSRSRGENDVDAPIGLTRRRSFHDLASWVDLPILPIDYMKIDVELCGQLLIMARREEHLRNVVLTLRHLTTYLSQTTADLSETHHTRTLPLLDRLPLAPLTNIPGPLLSEVEITAQATNTLLYESEQMRVGDLWSAVLAGREKVWEVRQKVFGTGTTGTGPVALNSGRSEEGTGGKKGGRRKKRGGERDVHGSSQWRIGGGHVHVDAKGRTESEVEEEEERGWQSEREEEEQGTGILKKVVAEDEDEGDDEGEDEAEVGDGGELAAIKPMWLLRFFTQWGVGWRAQPQHQVAGLGPAEEAVAQGAAIPSTEVTSQQN